MNQLVTNSPGAVVSPSRPPLETSSFKVTGIALNTRATADNRKRGAKRVEIDFNIVPLYNNYY